MNEGIAEPAEKKRRPRFSLLNLLLLMTIAAMGVALWRLNGELAPMRAELAELRNETGRLFVEDKEKLHAIRVATTEFDRWKFRVWLPEGRRYWLWNERQRVPEHDVPGQGSGSGLESGEHVIEVVLTPDKEHPGGVKQDRMKMSILVDGHLNRTATLSERTEDWIDNQEVGGRMASYRGIENEAVRFPADLPMVLMRYRANRPANIRRDEEGKVRGHSWGQIEGTTDGMMLWIAEQE